MRLEVKGRNVEVNDSIRRYAEDKLDKIEKQLPEPTQIEVELTLENNPSIADDHIAEATDAEQFGSGAGLEQLDGGKALIDRGQAVPGQG